MWEYIQTVVLSIIIIILAHAIYNYIKNNFTHERHKNIIDTQTQKYKNIISQMSSLDTSEEDLLQYALDEANK